MCKMHLKICSVNITVTTLNMCLLKVGYGVIYHLSLKSIFEFEYFLFSFSHYHKKRHTINKGPMSLLPPFIPAYMMVCLRLVFHDGVSEMQTPSGNPHKHGEGVNTVHRDSV